MPGGGHYSPVVFTGHNYTPVYPTWDTKYTPVSHIGAILDTGVHDCTMYTLCSGVLFSRGQCHTVTAQCSVFQDVHLRWNLSG